MASVRHRLELRLRQAAAHRIGMIRGDEHLVLVRPPQLDGHAHAAEPMRDGKWRGECDVQSGARDQRFGDAGACV